MKIFLATPFSTKVDSDTGEVLPDFRKFVEGILKLVRQNGAAVYCGVEDEDWKIQDGDPIKAWRKDWEELKSADLFVAILEEGVSPGVQIEIGAAISWGKKIVLVTETEDQKLQWTNSTICKVPEYDIILVKGVNNLESELNKLMV